MYTCGGQESAQLSRLLDVLPFLCENAVNLGLAWSFSRWSDSSACSARTQGAMKTGPAPDESPVSVRSDNTYIMGWQPIRFGAMGPWNQPYSMDLVRVGEFVLAYLPNPTSYGHETYTIGYSKDWRLKRCVEILWQPHQIWSYGPVKSAMFHGFGLGWLICVTISPEPYKLWTWDLHHWIQQRLTFKRMCRNTVTTPSDLELWAREISYVSWIWFMWVNLCWHISWTLQAMDMRLVPLDTTKIEV